MRMTPDSPARSAVADIDIVVAGCEIHSSVITQSNIAAAGRVAHERIKPDGGVAVAARVAIEEPSLLLTDL
jgi:hypothetical protein